MRTYLTSQNPASRELRPHSLESAPPSDLEVFNSLCLTLIQTSNRDSQNDLRDKLKQLQRRTSDLPSKAKQSSPYAIPNFNEEEVEEMLAVFAEEIENEKIEPKDNYIIQNQLIKAISSISHSDKNFHEKAQSIYYKYVSIPLSEDNALYLSYFKTLLFKPT